VRLGTISSRRETKIRILGRRPPPAAERHLRELRDDDDISEVLLSPPPFWWCLPVGGASAAPPFRADVANGGSGHLSRQPRGGSRGGAAVAVAPSQLGGAWGAERLPAIPREKGPHPSRMPRPRCPTQAPDGKGGWQPFCARGARELLRPLAGGSQVGFSPMWSRIHPSPYLAKTKKGRAATPTVARRP